TIAAGTLDLPTDFTLTPLDALAGAPASASLVGGVLIEPADAIFADGATLVIVPAAAPGDDLPAIGFKFYSGGTSFHLRPLDDNADGSGPLDRTLAVWGGGAYGTIDLSADDARAFADQHIPDHLLDAVAQMVATQDDGVPNALLSNAAAPPATATGL